MGSNPSLGGMGILPQENLEIWSALGVILGLYFIKKVNKFIHAYKHIFVKLIFMDRYTVTEQS